MPNYAFRCENCREVYERSMTYAEFEEYTPPCPLCKGDGRRMIFPVPVHMRYSLLHPRHMRGQRGHKPGGGVEVT